MSAPDVEEIKAGILKDWPRGQRPPSGPEFESYCGVIARMHDAQARLAAEGSIIADAKGNPVPHPSLAIERQCAEQLRKWGRRFQP